MILAIAGCTWGCFKRHNIAFLHASNSAPGYFVFTVGFDEGIVRAYIRNQEHEDKCYDQMKLDV